MPRRAKKLNTKLEQHANRLSTKSDFTVYDYADPHKGSNVVSASVTHCKTRPSGRLQKAATNAWRTEAKELRGHSVMHQSWLTSSTGNAHDVSDEDDDEVDLSIAGNGFTPVKQRSASKHQQNGSKPTRRPAGEDGLVYPVDLWYLIGGFIAPEDVRTFACICHDTHSVVHSARFWLCLYRRYCHSSNSLLPLSLQSFAVEHRPHGLRTRVIRALFHVYPLLSERVVVRALSQSDPQKLIGLRCVLAWQERAGKPYWKFYFKFRCGSGRLNCPLSVKRGTSANGLLSPSDVLHNPDERCVILIITTPHFLPLPLVMGQVLIKASVTGSIFTQSLHLTFCSEYIESHSRSDVAGSVPAQFHPFISARILHWWHPSYPHRH